MLKCFVGEVDVVDAVNLIMTKFHVIAECCTVKVSAPDRLDNIMGEVRPGGYEDVDIPVFHQI